MQLPHEERAILDSKQGYVFMNDSGQQYIRIMQHATLN